MYGTEDIFLAKRRVKVCVLRLAGVLAPLLALYVFAVIRNMPGMMLATLLAGFAWCMFAGDMWLLPALRYWKFLKEMDAGLRRSVECVLCRVEDTDQLRDGVHVRALHVELCDGGDSRIYYVNRAKLHLLPDMNRRVRLTSYGRHVVECGEG